MPVLHDSIKVPFNISPFPLQDFKYGRELTKLLQDAGQEVPPELSNCGPGTGGGGRSRYGNSGGGGGFGGGGGCTFPLHRLSYSQYFDCTSVVGHGHNRACLCYCNCLVEFSHI